MKRITKAERENAALAEPVVVENPEDPGYWQVRVNGEVVFESTSKAWAEEEAAKIRAGKTSKVLESAKGREYARMVEMNDKAQAQAALLSASLQEQATLRHILAMPDQPLAEVLKAAAGKIDFLGRDLTASEQAHRFTAKEADKAVNALKERLNNARDSEEALRQDVERFAAKNRENEGRAERAELALRKVADALGLSPEQAAKIATGK